MNIALVARRYAPHAGGLERHVHELARGLVRRGASVEVLSQECGSGLPGLSELDGVVVRRFSVPGHQARFAATTALSDYLRRTATSFDVVHALCAHPLIALVAARAHPKRLVFSPRAPMARLMRWPYGRATRAVVHLAAQTICSSRVEADLLCRALPTAADRVRVVPEAVDVAAIRSAQPFSTANAVVLTVGRLARDKRVDRVIAAMAGLTPVFELVVIGDGPARRRLRDFAADLQVASRVRFVGRVPDADLYRWLRTARVLVTLSQEECFGLPVLEGIAAGAPVVASDIAAHREAASFARGIGVTFVSSEGSPLEVADAISHACTIRPQATELPLPSFADVVNTTLALYEGRVPGRLSTYGRHARLAKPHTWELDGRPDVAVTD
jgi:glycosyltransferase involved in cell wall biosynthesis